MNRAPRFVFPCLLLTLLVLSITSSASAQDCVEEYPDPFVPGTQTTLVEPLLELKTAPERLFGLDESGYLLVFDNADPLQPTVLSRTMLDTLARRVEPVGDWLYVAAQASGVYAVDVSDPAVPVIHADVIAGVDAFDVEFCTDHLFVSQFEADSLAWYSCADPVLPAFAGSVTLQTLTDGGYTGFLMELESEASDLFAAARETQWWNTEYLLTRTNVEWVGEEIQLTPAGTFVAAQSSDWVTVYPEGIDLACDEGRFYAVVPSWTFWIDPPYYENVKANGLRIFDTTAPTGLTQVQYLVEEGAELRFEPRLAVPAPNKLALAGVYTITLYDLNADGTVASENTLARNSRVLAGGADVLAWSGQSDLDLETVDVSGSDFAPRIDRQDYPASRFQYSRWYEGADWTTGSLATYFYEYGDYGMSYISWWFWHAESDGSISRFTGSPPIGTLYFFTDNYAYYGLSDGYGVGPLLQNWRTGQVVYEQPWSLNDSRNVYAGDLVYHSDAGNIGIYDFTAYPCPLVGTIAPPATCGFVSWLIRGDHLIVNCSGSSPRLVTYDVSDPASPALAFDSGSLGGSDPFEMSLRGDVVSLTRAVGDDCFFDISDPAAPVAVAGDFYPGEVFGNVALNVVDGTDVEIYRVISPSESELIGLYRHDDTIRRAKRWENSLVVLDTWSVMTLLDICGPYESAVGDGDVPALADEAPSLTIRSTAPNPFNPCVNLAFSVTREQRVRVDVFDVAGRHVAKLADRVFSAGDHEATWNGRTDRGRTAASGSYILRVRGEGMTLARKVTLIQ